MKLTQYILKQKKCSMPKIKKRKKKIDRVYDPIDKQINCRLSGRTLNSVSKATANLRRATFC